MSNKETPEIADHRPAVGGPVKRMVSQPATEKAFEMTGEELSVVYEWAESHAGKSLIARAYYNLIDSKNGIDKANKAIGDETVNFDEEDDVSEEWCAAYDAINSLDDAWFEAREILGRRCLAVIKLANVANDRMPTARHVD